MAAPVVVSLNVWTVPVSELGNADLQYGGSPPAVGNFICLTVIPAADPADPTSSFQPLTGQNSFAPNTTPGFATLWSKFWTSGDTANEAFSTDTLNKTYTITVVAFEFLGSSVSGVVDASLDPDFPSSGTVTSPGGFVNPSYGPFTPSVISNAFPIALLMTAGQSDLLGECVLAVASQSYAFNTSTTTDATTLDYYTNSGTTHDQFALKAVFHSAATAGDVVYGEDIGVTVAQNTPGVGAMDWEVQHSLWVVYPSGPPTSVIVSQVGFEVFTNTPPAAVNARVSQAGFEVFLTPSVMVSQVGFEVFTVPPPPNRRRTGDVQVL